MAGREQQLLFLEVQNEVCTVAGTRFVAFQHTGFGQHRKSTWALRSRVAVRLGGFLIDRRQGTDTSVATLERTNARKRGIRRFLRAPIARARCFTIRQSGSARQQERGDDEDCA